MINRNVKVVDEIYYDLEYGIPLVATEGHVCNQLISKFYIE